MLPNIFSLSLLLLIHYQQMLMTEGESVSVESESQEKPLSNVGNAIDSLIEDEMADFVHGKGTGSIVLGEEEVEEEKEEGRPTVSTSYGRLTGVTVQLDPAAGLLDAFYGVPYAKPPTKELRFEKTEPPVNWGTKQLAVDNADQVSCYPHARPDALSVLVQQGNKFSEDCLFLNIFRPAKRANNNLPVLVIIHGGGFEIGAARQYSSDPRDIYSTFVSHGIIVVVVQYRLGIFGFASTGDSILPGNLGLWDQVQALKFVNGEIKNFGGDPNRITLFGHSAGSASVSILGAVPQSRDLFQRAIQMSGSGLSPWVYGSRVPEESRKVFRKLGCGGNSNRIKKCLKKKRTTPKRLWKAVAKSKAARNDPNCLKFTPRLDSDFFPADMQELIAQAKPKPTLIGHTELEALIFTLLTSKNSLTHQSIPGDQLQHFNKDTLKNYIKDKVVPESLFPKTHDNLVKQIYDFYAKNVNNQGPFQTVHQYTKLISDLLFVMPIMEEVRLKAKSNWPVYMYVSKFMENDRLPIKESFHFYDHGLIFKCAEPPNRTYEGNELDIRNFMLNSFRNFIINGKPLSGWTPVPSNGQLRHMLIDVDPKMVDDRVEDMERMKFWSEMSKGKFDFIHEIAKGVKNNEKVNESGMK